MFQNLSTINAFLSLRHRETRGKQELKFHKFIIPKKLMDESLYKLIPLVPTTMTWTMLFSSIESLENVTNKTKEEYREALQFLKKELGVGFFDTCGINHPIQIKLRGCSEWQINANINWINTLRQLSKSECNYPHLLHKVKRREKCKTEGMPFLEVVRPYIDEGFVIHFLEEETEKRTPDIEIKDPTTNDLFLIEITKLMDSQPRVKIMDEYYRIIDTINFGYDLPFSCTQLKELTAKRLDLILEIIKNLKDNAVKNQTLASYVSDEIAMAFVHPAKYSLLQEWCQQHNRQQGMFGREIDFNDTNRIVKQSRIKKEIQHFPSHLPGLIYMPVSYLYMLSMDVVETIERFAKVLHSYPNIMGLVLFADITNENRKEEFFEEDHIYFIKKINPGITRYLLYVHNHFFVPSLSEKTLEKIQKCIKFLI